MAVRDKIRKSASKTQKQTSDRGRLEYEIWVRKLRALRRSKGWLQKDVIERMPRGMSRCHYVSIEHGQSNVTYRHLYNLSQAFGLTMAEMVTLDVVSPDVLKASIRKDLQSKTPVKIKKQPAFRLDKLSKASDTAEQTAPVELACATHAFGHNNEQRPGYGPSDVTSESHAYMDFTSQQSESVRGRPKGSRVVTCTCGARVVGMPGTRKECYFCKKTHKIPKKVQF